jgi:hypothetical protein
MHILIHGEKVPDTAFPHERCIIVTQSARHFIALPNTGDDCFRLLSAGGNMLCKWKKPEPERGLAEV